MRLSKKLIAMMFVSLALAVSAMASEKVSFPAFDVTFNGQLVSSQARQYPLIVYKDITYIPMTYYDTRFLGLATDWNNETRTISIKKADSWFASRDYSSDKTNKAGDKAEICSFNIVVNGKNIDNQKEKYPLLVYRDVTYFPLTWRFAVDEFGWNYSFSHENGLVITSNNAILEKITLPDMRTYEPSVATDGKYWYYTGNNNKIYRLLREDWGGKGPFEPEVIHTLKYTYYPDTTLVSFSYWQGNVFMTYHIGGASTGTTYRYKINSEGSCESSSEGTYKYGMIGANGYNIDADGFTVERYNSGRTGTSTVYYRFDGSEEYIEIKLDGIRFGEYKDKSISLHVDGTTLLGTNAEGNTWFNDPQVIGSRIYLTGYDEKSNTNSSLYVCDTKTGEINKLIDNVGVFYAFSGWDNTAKAVVDMIVYDRQGTRYRYSTYNSNEIVIDTNVRPMKTANLEEVGLAVVGDDGKTAEVKWYDGYGSGSIKTTVFETDSGMEFNVVNGNLYAYNYNQSDRKLAVFYKIQDNFVTGENAQNVFVTDHSVLFIVNDERPYVFEVELD